MAKQRHELGARDEALIRLDRGEFPGWRARLLPDWARGGELDPKEGALAEALYVGVVKNLLGLKARVAFHAGKPLKAIDPLVQKILVLGAWQLVGMDRIPAAVAVDQAVEQCRRFGRAKAAGLVNAVLRNFARQEAPPVDKTNPEVVYSFPRETFARLKQVLGEKEAKAFCTHANGEPPLTLRLFPGVTMEMLAAEGVTLTPHSQQGMVVARGAKRATIREWAEKALAQPQDPTAALVASFADLKPGLSFLDRCAGVGTKTLQFQTLLGNGARVDAVDPNPQRCQALVTLGAKRGIPNLHVHQAANLSAIADLPAAFDRVLVDVPCSNSGVLARRPEARYHQGEREFTSLGKLQSEILSDSADRVATGGLLIYSTCSIWPEENGTQVRSFLKRDKRFVLRVEKETLPQGSTGTENEGKDYRDGGYVAVLLKDSDK